jgi:hypothetical protein
LAAAVLIAQGPSFVRNIFGRWDGGNDFLQDWTSARNVLEGRPVYLPLSISVPLYYPRADGNSPPLPTLPWNAHPPSSVVATLPFALLGYLNAMTLWNVLGLLAIATSLTLIVLELRFPLAAWAILPTVALALICGPVRMQIEYGQWNAPLLLLLTMAWVDDRRGRYIRTGFWVALAGTLKVFPLFFLFYFAARQRWVALVSCLIGLVALSVGTAGILGLDAYRDYVRHVLPTLREYHAYWNNASIQAFWMKNFWTGANLFGLRVEPLVSAPMLARAGIILSYAIVLATSYKYLNKRRPCFETTGEYGDLCFSLSLVAMLLLAPVCWDHYLLLLALPLSLIWVGLEKSSLSRLAFMVLVAAVWVGPTELYKMGGVNLKLEWPDFQIVPPGSYVLWRPLFPPLFLSVHFYALVASYLWLMSRAWRVLALASPARIGPATDP